MSDKFTELAKDFYVTSQILPEDIEAAHALGITLIISNRPDNEEEGQPANSELEEKASELGIKFATIPVDRKGITLDHIDEFRNLTDDYEGSILAFCRSGTRSTTLRAYALANKGPDTVSEILVEAADAGYNLYPIAPGLEAVIPERRRVKRTKPKK